MGVSTMEYELFKQEAHAWEHEDIYRDDLNTMDDPETQLDNQGIEDWEEGFIRGFMASA